MKEWRCIIVSHHDEVGRAIMEREQQGCRLNSYFTARMGGAFNYTVYHYFLFERVNRIIRIIASKQPRLRLR